jgi:hypothetical protein
VEATVERATRSAGVFGLISVLWMIVGGILLVLKVLAREDDIFEGEKIVYRN